MLLLNPVSKMDIKIKWHFPSKRCWNVCCCSLFKSKMNTLLHKFDKILSKHDSSVWVSMNWKVFFHIEKSVFRVYKIQISFEWQTDSRLDLKFPSQTDLFLKATKGLFSENEWNFSWQELSPFLPSCNCASPVPQQHLTIKKHGLPNVDWVLI